MSPGRALGYLIEITIRIFGLAIIIAESVVPLNKKAQRAYIKAQREIMNIINEDLDLYEMLSESGVEGVFEENEW